MTTVLDVVVPVYNEEAVLAASVRRLHDHLLRTFPYPFRITVADNGSTDGTWEVAQHLVTALPAVAAVRLDEKGRGRALNRVWSESDAVVLAYVDVDLSTDLDALWPLVAPLISGHSDVAIGTRLHRSARVVRGPKREVISRCYNLILRTSLGARFSDAQCGFKAVRADVAAELLPLVEDTSWFFDTELLVLAERCGLRIHEVPVDWYDDPDSRVAIVSTARDDLRGVWRVGRNLALGRLPVAEIAERIGPAPVRGPRTMRTELVIFALIGVLSTVLHLGGFVALREVVASAPAANAIALLVAAVANTSANRRWTFGVLGRPGAARHQVQGLIVFAVTLGLTTAGLDLLEAAMPGAPTSVETLVVAATTVTGTAQKFLAMKLWVFAPDSLRPARARQGRVREQGTTRDRRTGRPASLGRTGQATVGRAAGSAALACRNCSTVVIVDPSTRPPPAGVQAVSEAPM